MKKFINIFFITAAFLLFTTRSSYSQYVTIPDNEFSAWLNQGYFSSCMNGNMLDTTCSKVVSAENLLITYTDIKNLEGLQYFRNLTQLTVEYNDSLTTIPSLNARVKEFDCRYNNLTSLPMLNDSLEWLNCSFNPLTSLPPLPIFLRTLACAYHNLTSLPLFPDSLRFIAVQSGSITSLPPLPPYLESLSCHQNEIDTIQYLPNGISYLSCWGNNMSTLPTLPDSLTRLYCGESPLFTSVPALPSKLELFNVSQASLTSLPTLPSSLRTLDCRYNQLTVLPALPDSLRDMVCTYNQLTYLPSLPPTLYRLACTNNNLTSLPELPDFFTYLQIDNNPGLTCLPELGFVSNFSFVNTGITCLPNYGTINSSNPPLAGFPLCDLFNQNGCDAYWNLGGKVYADTNSNCTADFNETRFGNIKLMLDSAGTPVQQTYSGGEGFYSFDTDTGVYNITVDTTGLPVVFTCPPSGFHNAVLTAVDSMEYDLDFGLECKPGFDLAIHSVTLDSGTFRPANFTRLVFHAGDLSVFYGLHCASGISGEVKISMNGPASFIAPAPGALIPQVIADTLIYTIPDFGMLNWNTDIVYIFQVDTNASMNNLVCFNMVVTPFAGDINILNNTLQHCFEITNSYDPNDKAVYPIGNIDTTITSLTYTINFQNTGNAPAQHIYIIDTLDQSLNELSFRLIDYSHRPLVQISGNQVRFNFPGINLPDSVNNEPSSHGYIKYAVDINAGTPLGTIISNTAHIYFDFNSPVVTNTVTNSIVDCELLQLVAVSYSDTSLCQGTVFSAVATPTGPMQLTWFIDSIFAGSGSVLQTTITTPGWHTVELKTNNNVCSKIYSQSVWVNEVITPVINLNGTSLYTGSGLSHQWFLNGDTIVGAVDDTLSAPLTGWYMVAATDTNGCTAYSDSVYVTVVALQEIIQTVVAVSPNPFNEILNIETSNEGLSEIRIYDVQSRKLLQWEFVKTVSINTAGLAAGMYVYEVRGENGERKIGKIVKE